MLDLDQGKQLTRAYYEQPALWDRDLAARPEYREKTEVLRKLIPQGVRTILDVGCGNGAIANTLASDCSVVGLDASETALKHLRTPAILGSATHLPVASASVDLVLSSEMLEHLADDDFRAAVSEIRRAARRHILISVPNAEKLKERHVRCPRCRAVSHVYDHRRSFNRDALRDLFAPDYTMVTSAFCGLLMPPDYPDWLLRIRQEWLGVYWRVTADYFPLCRACGNSDFRPKRPLREFCGRALTTLTYRILTCRTPRHPDWVVVLYEKPVGVSGA